MEQEMLEHRELFIIICGIVAGTVARLATLQVDERQNPSYPNGYFIHLVMGFVAACLGAVAIPALLAKNYTAVTFLTLAIQHFRDIRKMERDSLTVLDSTDFAPRGDAYIDGISKTYEARNYIALITSFVTVLALILLYRESVVWNLGVAAVAGGLSILFLYRLTNGNRVGDICRIHRGEMTIQGSELYVDGIFVTNTLGTDNSRAFVQREAVALVVSPAEEAYRLTLENSGQRQAMLYEAVRSFGVRRYQYTRRSFETGQVVIVFVPIVRDEEGIMAAIANTPVLESSRKTLRLAKPGE